MALGSNPPAPSIPAEPSRAYCFWAFPESAAGWQRLWPYALLLGVTFALYWPTVSYRFVWDDKAYILENARIQGSFAAILSNIWTRPYFRQYAPLHLSLLAALYSISGPNPFYFHLAQLLLHAACVCLLYPLLKKLESPRVALVATLFFAVYPPNVENVAWVSETKSTLAFLFFLLAFRFFLRFEERERPSDGLGCAALLIFSLLSKMSMVVAPLVLLFYAWRPERRPEQRWSNKKIGLLSALFLISGIFSAVHFTVSRPGSLQTSKILWDAAITDIPASIALRPSAYFGGFGVHLLNLPLLLLFYLRSIVLPYPLSAWHMVHVYGELGWQVGLGWIGLLGLLWLLYRSPRELRFWQLWFYIFLAPVLELVPNPTWVADRYLYVPAIGAFVLLGKGFFWVSGRAQATGLRLSWDALLASCLAAFAWQTHRYVPVWQNDLTLWRATAKTCPTSAYCHAIFGNVLFETGHSDLASRELYQAVQIRPDPDYLMTLGTVYADGLHDYARALRAYQFAIQFAHGNLRAESWAKIATAYYESGQTPEAARIVADHEGANPNSPELLVAKAFILARQGDLLGADLAVNHAMRLTNQPLNATQLLAAYWPDPEEAGRMLRYLAQPLTKR